MFVYNFGEGDLRHANAWIIQCLWIGHTSFQLRGGHYHWAIAASSKSSSPGLGVRWCYDVSLGRYWETNNKRKRIKLPLTIYHDFMQSLFIIFWDEGQCISQTTGALTFASLRSNLFPWFKWLLSGWRKWLWRGRCRAVVLVGVADPFDDLAESCGSPWQNHNPAQGHVT